MAAIPKPKHPPCPKGFLLEETQNASEVQPEITTNQANKTELYLHNNSLAVFARDI